MAPDMIADEALLSVSRWQRSVVERKQQMMTGNIDDVNPPRGMKNIVLEVMEYVRKHSGSTPTDFEVYDDALHAVWPELYKSCPEAALLVSISIYIDIAERWGFEAHPEEIKELRL